ncbi:MAG TPA: outer membrane lipoprotein carrier protein LolA [Verrucomicrobiae bacterium]|nr:outer membrane lipoprotein carrier protein LolA [Verrucomicrobiae bacterium]
MLELFLCAALAGPACGPTLAPAADAGTILDSWIGAQKAFKTWTADFTQTRALKSLNRPLVSTGKVWFSNPNRFRWETMNPAPTIAVRDADQMMVIYPRLKRAERYLLGGEASGPMGDALALLDVGFPRDRASFDARFRLVSVVPRNGRWELRMQPAKIVTRRLVPELTVQISTNDFELATFEVTFADGSRMRNQFTRQEPNAPIADDVFRPTLPPDFKITEPLRK